MDQNQIIEVGAKAMWVTLEISLPVLGVSLVVGLLVSIFQAVTQLQEPTLTFIPKILAVVLVIVIAGPWMMKTSKHRWSSTARAARKAVSMRALNWHSARSS